MKNFIAPIAFNFTILFAMSLMIGCGRGLEGETPPFNVPEKVSGEVCYLTACAPTVDAAQVEDHASDYEYPDHQKFPNESRREQYRPPANFLDLKAQSGRLRVAENFLLNEFIQVEKGRYGIALPILVESLQSIRNTLASALYITSGYRSPGYNSQIDGSAKWSRHTYGDAADLYFPSLKKLEKECIEKQASFVLVYTSHVHCDWRDVPLHHAFYPPSVKPPPLGPSASYIALTREISRQMRIVKQKSEDGIVLSVVLPDIEIEGELVYRWYLYDRSGEVSRSTRPDLVLPMDSQPYYVEVIVGESLRTEAVIEW